MVISAIILDLDGTVLCSDKSISAYTLDVLERCKAQNIKIIVATARSETAAKQHLVKINPDAVISNGGALVRCNGKPIYTAPLPAKTADTIISAVIQLPNYLEMTVETAQGYYVSYQPEDSGDYSHAIYHDFSMPLSQDAYKITVKLSNNNGLQAVADNFPQCCLIPFSGECWYRFANKHATKMIAIKEMAEHYGFAVSQIAAFGDDYNDEEMLRQCGIGVAMANGVSLVRKSADYICDTNDNDGVAKWLESYVLQA